MKRCREAYISPTNDKLISGSRRGSSLGLGDQNSILKMNPHVHKYELDEYDRT